MRLRPTGTLAWAGWCGAVAPDDALKAEPIERLAERVVEEHGRVRLAVHPGRDPEVLEPSERSYGVAEVMAALSQIPKVEYSATGDYVEVHIPDIGVRMVVTVDRIINLTVLDAYYYDMPGLLVRRILSGSPDFSVGRDANPTSA